jgi:hypothetical protein
MYVLTVHGFPDIVVFCTFALVNAPNLPDD